MGSRCEKLYVRQFNEDEKRVRLLRLPCNSWKCEICRPVKQKKLRYGAVRGMLDFVESRGLEGFRYAVKMVSLTLPGREWRSRDHSLVYREDYSGSNSIEDAHKIIKENWGKLRDTLAKNPLYDDFVYFSVVESQRDGYPHLHVVFLGKVIAQRRILFDIRKLWAGKYGMGNVDIVTAKHGIKGAVCYVVKYLSEFPSGLPKGLHFYFSSHGLIKSGGKVGNNWTSYEFGFVHGESLFKLRDIGVQYSIKIDIESNGEGIGQFQIKLPF